MFTIRLLSDFKYAFYCIRKHGLLGGWVGDCHVFVYLFIYASTPFFYADKLHRTYHHGSSEPISIGKEMVID